MQNVNEIQDIIENLKKYQPLKVILFGSYARGDINLGSDIDLLIIKDTDKKFTKRIDEVLDLCGENTKLEPLVYTSSEINDMINRKNDFICTILREGIVLYG